MALMESQHLLAEVDDGVDRADRTDALCRPRPLRPHEDEQQQSDYVVMKLHGGSLSLVSSVKK